MESNETLQQAMVGNMCSQLNGIFNPKQDQQEQRMKLELVKASGRFNREALFELRTRLVKAIDPLQSSGADLQDIIMRCTRTSIGEVKDFFDPDPMTQLPGREKS